jgi:hypothetical protein
MKTPSSQIDRQLTQIACDQVILHAAKVYAANLDPNIDYGGFIVIGAEECLCLPDVRTPVSNKQRLERQKHERINWASSPDDLTFLGCIQWLMLRLYDEDDDGDAVTMKQVLAVLEGHRFFNPCYNTPATLHVKHHAP